ncbi:MAG: phosphoribosylglycinamide formyltransferase-1 [Cryomorphaceae bacterium]|jgi:phosphoribosylglycinamide formyltransferase-1
MSDTKTRAVVLISGGGTNLQAFIDAIEAGTLTLQIELVISNQAQAYGLQRATDVGIPTVHIDHRDYSTRLDFDRALIDEIDSAGADLIILAGFMRILTADFVDHYANRLINIHPSLLPKFPGTDTHTRALEASEHWHGVSIHFVVPEVDAGPIILQGRLAIKPDDTPESLQQRIHKIEHKLYPLAAQWFAQKRLLIESKQVLLDGERSPEQLQTFDL